MFVTGKKEEIKKRKIDSAKNKYKVQNRKSCGF